MKDFLFASGVSYQQSSHSTRCHVQRSQIGHLYKLLPSPPSPLNLLTSLEQALLGMIYFEASPLEWVIFSLTQASFDSALLRGNMEDNV